MKKAGSARPSANRIMLLRDADGDGVAEISTTLLSGLSSPFGMAFVGDELFVANADGARRLSLPARPDDDRDSAAQRDRAAVGLQSPLDQVAGRLARRHVAVRRRRIEQQCRRERHGDGEGPRRDLENRCRRPARTAFSPAACATRSGSPGTRGAAPCGPSVNERDEIGNDLVPDYMTSVSDGAFYGWPCSYYGQHVDGGSSRRGPDMVAKAIAPDYALGRARRDARPDLQRPASALGPRIRQRRVRRRTWLLEPQAARAATRWFSCPSRVPSRRASRSTSSPVSAVGEMRTAARSASDRQRRQPARRRRCRRQGLAGQPRYDAARLSLTARQPLAKLAMMLLLALRSPAPPPPSPSSRSAGGR